MSIRPANFGDIPRLAELIVEMHARSIYRDRASVDLKATKGDFVQSLQRHGGKNAGNTLVMVAENDGVIEGFILGILDRVYPCLDRLLATDLYFYVSDRGDPRDAGRLLDALIAWADGNPNVIEVRMGAVAAIGDWRRTEKLYVRKGLRQSGVIYEKSSEGVPSCPAS